MEFYAIQFTVTEKKFGKLTRHSKIFCRTQTGKKVATHLFHKIFNNCDVTEKSGALILVVKTLKSSNIIMKRQNEAKLTSKMKSCNSEGDS